MKFQYIVAVVTVLCTNQICAEHYINYKKIIDDLYGEASGFRIPDEERECIKQVGGDPTYGEIVYESAEVLIDYLQVTEDDVFGDLGSGMGRLVLQFYLTTPAKKSVGIELSETRNACAKRIEKQVSPDLYDVCINAENGIRKALNKKRVPKVSKKTITFIEEDMLKANLSDATIIFTCSTCFSDELMAKITKKLEKLKDGLRFITLKQIPESYEKKVKETVIDPATEISLSNAKKIDPQAELGKSVTVAVPEAKFFKLDKTFTLRMTWSTTTPVYLYILDHTKKETRPVAQETDTISELDELFEAEDISAADTSAPAA